MLVVADASPIIALVQIDAIFVLPPLFEAVVVPPEVISELRQENRSQAVRLFMHSIPPWLIQQVPSRLIDIPGLHAGELAAISLAIEIGADILLIDEVVGRKAAHERNVRVTGTIGILEAAAERGLLDLTEAFTRIKQTDFWISHELLDERLKVFEERRRSG